MNPDAVKRKLAAILCADVVGYSRLMGDAEEATLRTLNAYRKIIDGLIAQHGGRIFGSAGDSVIAEFASAVEAVRCAAEIQQNLTQPNTELPESRRMRFRIGVNLGDVIVEGDNLLGDGVNIAARLEAIAEPGGICISATVHEQVRNKLDVRFVDLGARSAKNIRDRLHVYRVRLDDVKSAGFRFRAPQRKPRVGTAVAAIVAVIALGIAVTWPMVMTFVLDLTGLSGPRRGSTESVSKGNGEAGSLTASRRTWSTIAVLEFRNERGDDREHDWMSTALQTAFSTELNKVKELRVYSREFVQERARTGGGGIETARSLGASRFISGSFAVYAGIIRVDARLVDVDSGLQESAESVEGGLDEFFNLQKELALNMLARLPVEVTEGERASIAAVNESQNQNLALDAYRLLLQGEGLDEPATSEGAATDQQPRSELKSSVSVLRAIARRLSKDSIAHADEENAAEQEVRQILEDYRLALQNGNLESIGKARGMLTERQRAGLEAYFENAEDLSVEFAGLEIEQVDADRFVVSYLRRDKFADPRTGQTVSLEVHLENSVVREGDDWKILHKKALSGS